MRQQRKYNLRKQIQLGLFWSTRHVGKRAPGQNTEGQNTDGHNTDCI